MFGNLRLYLRANFALICLIGIMSFTSCRSTRFVPEDKYLLNRVSVKIDNREIKRDELKGHIKQKENLRILGFLKFHLGMYNLSSAKKQDDWLKRIGEAPVLFEEAQAKRSVDQLKIFLRNKGYYDAEVKDSLVRNDQKRKVNLSFVIRTNEPFRMRNFFYNVKDTALQGYILQDSVNCLLKRDHRFDLDLLNAERQRISNYCRNLGYFKFSEDYISFQADTISGNQVDLYVNIDDAVLDNSEQEAVPHRRYKIDRYEISLLRKAAESADENTAQRVDTLRRNPYTFLYSGKFNYKPTLFSESNKLPDSTYYSLLNAEKTYKALSRLKQFRLINIGFKELITDSAELDPTLDCTMQLSLLPRQNVSLDVEGTNSSGNLGVAGNFNYQHRNVFRGAEIFDFQIRGASERQNLTNSFFNTREFGFESSLTIPKFISILKGHKLFGYQVPETKFTLGFNYQNRPDYTRTITNLKFGYNWKTTDFQYHTLNMVDLNYVSIYQLDQDFIEKIEDLFIKSSFTDHLILASNYSWVYNSQNINLRQDYKYYRASFEAAGNLLSLYSRITNKQKVVVTDSVTGRESSYYEILKKRFAQYVKGDFEYRYGHIIDETSSVVGRAFVGIGLPFGNFNVLPFEKKYFTGGANGIRAWQVRSLGPGSYKENSRGLPNQSSDIKLEANLEYRFKLFWMMEGALFADAGNIWAINYKDNRPGAVFKFDEFYKQIAVGTGAGLRLDFTYFLFRLDLGMKLRDPSREPGERIIPGNAKLTWDKFNLSFAIGYPF